jgi:hypothetical protein
MISHNFNSIAFPAIGCGQHGCSVHVVVKTMVREMKTQLIKRNLPWTVKFIIQSDQPNIYDEFCKEVLATHHGKDKIFLLTHVTQIYHSELIFFLNKIFRGLR